MDDAYCNNLHKEEIFRHCNLNQCPPPAVWILTEDTPVSFFFKEKRKKISHHVQEQCVVDINCMYLNVSVGILLF